MELANKLEKRESTLLEVITSTLKSLKVLMARVKTNSAKELTEKVPSQFILIVREAKGRNYMRMIFYRSMLK